MISCRICIIAWHIRVRAAASTRPLPAIRMTRRYTWLIGIVAVSAMLKRVIVNFRVVAK